MPGASLALGGQFPAPAQPWQGHTPALAPCAPESASRLPSGCRDDVLCSLILEAQCVFAH